MPSQIKSGIKTLSFAKLSADFDKSASTASSHSIFVTTTISRYVLRLWKTSQIFLILDFAMNLKNEHLLAILNISKKYKI